MKPVFVKCLLFSLFYTYTVYAQTRPSRLILATYTYATHTRLDNLQPLAGVLSRELKVPVEVKSYRSVSDLIGALDSGRVDIALISTFGYLLMQGRARADYQPVVALQVSKGARDSYKTAIVAQAAMPLRSVDQLAGEGKTYRMTFVSETSTSGNLIPRAYLSSRNISPEKAFGAVTYSRTHAQAIAWLLSKQTDVAAMGSEEYVKAVEGDSVARQNLRLLWLSDEIVLGPVLLKKTLPASVAQPIGQVLLSLDRAEPAALNALKQGWSEARQAEKFRPVDHQYYEAYQKRIGASPGFIRELAAFIR